MNRFCPHTYTHLCGCVHLLHRNVGGAYMLQFLYGGANVKCSQLRWCCKCVGWLQLQLPTQVMVGAKLVSVTTIVYGYKKKFVLTVLKML